MIGRYKKFLRITRKVLKKFQVYRYISRNLTWHISELKQYYTYTIGHYNPSVRLTTTTLMLCALILYMSGGTYSLSRLRTTDLWETFHGNFIYFPSFCQKSAERKSPKKYLHIFVLMGGLNLSLTSNKSTHYLLDNGDFKQYYKDT